MFSYPSLISESIFCLITETQSASMMLFDILKFNCIPVIIHDELVLPFETFIDWNLISIQIRPSNLDSLMNILHNTSSNKIKSMIETLKFVYEKYFSSIKVITLNLLEEIQNRVYPMSRKTYEELNHVEIGTNDPFVIPYRPLAKVGYTVLIQTNETVFFEFLDKVLSTCSNLSNILVIWFGGLNEIENVFHRKYFNQNLMKKIGLDVKFKREFYGHDEIETEAILNLNDFNSNCYQIENAFQVWRDFPDRIVKFKDRANRSKISYFYHSIYKFHLNDENFKNSTAKSNIFVLNKNQIKFEL